RSRCRCTPASARAPSPDPSPRPLGGRAPPCSTISSSTVGELAVRAATGREGSMRFTRRDVIIGAGGAAIAPPLVLAQSTMPTRPIPSAGEQLPVIGLGSSKVVQEIAEHGTEPVAAVLRTLVA